METLNKIIEDINTVKEFNIDAGCALHRQLEESLHSHNSFDELTAIIKTDNDVADEHYKQTDSQHEDIRNIQDAIISFCAE